MQEMRPPWQYEDPLCAQVGGTFFFSQDRDDIDPTVVVDTTYNDAKKICKKCPHLIECALWGIANEEFGLWGGLTPLQRKHIKSKRAPFPYQKTA